MCYATAFAIRGGASTCVAQPFKVVRGDSFVGGRGLDSGMSGIFRVATSGMSVVPAGRSLEPTMFINLPAVAAFDASAGLRIVTGLPGYLRRRPTAADDRAFVEYRVRQRPGYFLRQASGYSRNEEAVRMSTESYCVGPGS